jgi:hypothetical protein
VSGASLAAVLSREAASAGVPAAVLSSTIRAVTLVAAGQAAAAGAVSGTAAALTEGVLRAMLLARLKIAAALVLVFALLAAGAGRLLLRTQAAAPAEAKQGKKEETRPPIKRSRGQKSHS